MKGLILKDLYCMRTVIASGIPVTLILGILWAFSGNYTFVAVMLPVMTSVTVTNTFAYDESYHWVPFSLTLPVKRKKIVAARYLTFLVVNISAVVTGSIYLAVLAIGFHVVNSEEILALAAASFAIPTIIVSICFPLAYRFGSQKMRLLFMLIIGTLVGGITLIAMALYKGGMNLEGLTEVSVWAWIMVGVLVSLVTLGISCLISTHIFEKKVPDFSI